MQVLQQRAGGHARAGFVFVRHERQCRGLRKSDVCEGCGMLLGTVRIGSHPHVTFRTSLDS
jgi:hypothetical protein